MSEEQKKTIKDGQNDENQPADVNMAADYNTVQWVKLTLFSFWFNE